MKRRTLLASLGVGGATLAGIGAVKVTSKPRPQYLKNERVVYERDDLDIEVLQDTIKLGDEVVFQVTNTGDSSTVLGCHNPWALQKRSEGEWQEVAWTGERYYQACATELSPGSTLEESVELSNPASKIKRERFTLNYAPVSIVS